MDLHILRINLGLRSEHSTLWQRLPDSARPLSLRRTKTPPRADTSCKLGAGTVFIG